MTYCYSRYQNDIGDNILFTEATTSIPLVSRDTAH